MRRYLFRRKILKKKYRKFFTGLVGLILIILIIRRLSKPGKLIVIDPGHGGEDPGSLGVGSSYEKDINLQLAKALNRKLKLRGYKVILTRDRDEYVDNNLRAEMANSKDADLFISIHCNAMENNTSIEGLQVLYYPNNSNNPRNEEIAGIFMENLLETTGSNNKGTIPREDLIVLNQTKMPAVLIETGFLTNELEAELLSNKKYQARLTRALLIAVDEVFS